MDQTLGDRLPLALSTLSAPRGRPEGLWQTRPRRLNGKPPTRPGRWAAASPRSFSLTWAERRFEGPFLKTGLRLEPGEENVAIRVCEHGPGTGGSGCPGIFDIRLTPRWCHTARGERDNLAPSGSESMCMAQGCVLQAKRPCVAVGPWPHLSPCPSASSHPATQRSFLFFFPIFVTPFANPTSS